MTQKLTPSPTGRLTTKKLVEWCNMEFKRLELNDWTVTRIVRTHYREDDYQSGACKLLCWFKHNDTPDDSMLNRTHRFVSFCSIGELEESIRNGYQLNIKNKGVSISHFELDVIKKS